jgi:hypothetical protein
MCSVKSSYCIPFHSVFHDFGTPLNMICQRLFDWFSGFFENRSYVLESVLRFLRTVVYMSELALRFFETRD